MNINNVRKSLNPDKVNKKESPKVGRKRTRPGTKKSESSPFEFLRRMRK